VRKLILLVGLILFILSVKAQYLHQQGKYIYDGQNKEIILRSMGLGGWMLQEPYMLNASSFAGTQHEIRAKIEGLIGKENTTKFYDAWLQNHCTKVDIDSLASWGFNAIRLPMHYNLFTLPIEQEPVVGADTWLPKGFAMIDSLLDWCKKDNIYLILDLHAAPGGQGKDAAISDYDDTKLSLWESAENRRKTVALWGKLAERYANEPMIGGYDLLNETNWTFTGTNLLKTLYTDITKAIRAVDKNHLIFIEGNWFANDFTGLTPAWDTNMAYSFHKYWNATDVGTIQYLLDMRNTQNIPLWMGESGENNNQWFYETIKMLETNHIGWSWWPLKKFGSVVCPFTVTETANYKKLVSYLANGGTKPDVTSATNTLLEMAENLKVKNCTFHPDYIDALFRQQKTDETKPYRILEIPGVLTAVDFDMGKSGIAYSDTWVMKDGTNNNGTGNNGYSYRNDGVDIEACTDTDSRNKGYSIGWIDANEWTQYTVDVRQTGAYTLVARYASGGTGGTFHLEKDGTNISGPIKVSGTGGWYVWKSITIPNVILYEGVQKLKIVFDGSGYNLNFMELKDPQPVSGIAAKISNAETSVDGNSILVYLNKKIDPTVLLNPSDFSVKIGTSAVTVSTASFDPNTPNGIILNIQQMVVYGNAVKVSYSGTALKTEDGAVLAAVSELPVSNNTPFRTTLPAKIEAEKYLVNSGLSSEACTDTGTGEDMGYTDAGDYLDYLIWVPTTGTYAFNYRLASNMTGSFELRLVDDPSKPVVIHTVSTPNTGGWQNWKTVIASGKLTQGPHTLRIFVKQPQFNINWFSISLVTGLNDLTGLSKIELYPNPVTDKITIKTEGIKGNFEIRLFNLQGILVRQLKQEFNSGTSEQIDISDCPDGFYLLSIENQSQKFRFNLIKMSR
jgi:endoglucanase